MADRRHGYDVSVGYPASFFPHLAPNWLDFCIRVQGFDPQRTGPSYRYAGHGLRPGLPPWPARRLPSEHGPPGRRVQARVGAGRRLAPRLPLIG